VPNFRFLFIGQTVSSFGDTLVPVALAFAVLDLTHSASDLGYVLGVNAATMVAFMLLGGIIADRISRRALMVAADAIRGAASLGLGVLLVTGRPAVLTLVVLNAIVGIATALFQPAATGLLPALVAPECLQRANAMQQSSAAAAGVAGPAVAGLLVVTVGPGWAIIADAATFGLNVVLLAQLRLSQVPRLERQHWVADLRAGWHDFWGRTWFRAVVLGFSVANFLFAAYMVLGPLASERLYDGAAAWATIATAMALGAVCGGLVALRFRPRHPMRAGLPLTALAGLTPVAIAGGWPIAVVVGLAGLGGAGSIIFGSLWQTSVQQHIPANMLSRASSYDYLGSLMAAPIGFALAGPMARAIGLRPVLLISGAIAILLLFGLLLVPAVRDLGDGIPEATRVPAQPRA
jgi:MFS family permease